MKCIILSSTLEGVGGVLVFGIAVLILIFLLSLLSRLTNTRVMTKSGIVVPVFKTPSEIKKQSEIDRIKFFVEAYEKVSNRQSTFQYSDNKFNDLFASSESIMNDIAEKEGVSSYRVENILKRGESDTIISRHKQLDSKFLNKEISVEEYDSEIKELFNYAMGNSE